MPTGDDALIDLADEAPAAEAGVSSEVVKDPRPQGTLEEAQSRAHQMTHLPKNPFCDVCSKAKMQRRQKRRKSSKLIPDDDARSPPTSFGEQVTGDHFIKNSLGDEDEDPNFPISTVAVVLFDRATKWLAAYPKATKTTYHIIEALHFAGPGGKNASFYSDNAPELVVAATACHWLHATATTGMPQTNGVAENCVRRTKEGGGCAVVQSGLNPATLWPPRLSITASPATLR